MTVAVYPGSFDPITNGHLDIIERAVSVFDGLTVLIAHNPSKVGTFNIEERKELIHEACSDPRVVVDEFQGLLVDYARSASARVVVRGLRAVADFELEGQMANMNRHLHPQLETFFMMASASNFYVSSSLVREVAKLGGDIGGLVPAPVARALARKFHSEETIP